MRIGRILRTMNYELRNNGFSLTEVLLAVGILAVGLLFIAGTFPVGIALTTVAAERTVAAVAADEAFAKIQLYGIDDFSTLTTQTLTDYDGLVSIDSSEYIYPSVDTGSEPSYYWSALCRKIDDYSGLVQVTVFICRKTGAHTKYPLDDPEVGVYDWPRPVPVRDETRGALRVWDSDDQIRITPSMEERKYFFVSGSTIITEPRGGIYRVLDRVIDPDIVLKLDRDLQEQDMVNPTRGITNGWVVPPAVGGGRNPTIGVYQRIIKF
jgi:prepilin-type N-terminal cleavage/methylation domain-containing protein